MEPVSEGFGHEGCRSNQQAVHSEKEIAFRSLLLNR